MRVGLNLIYLVPGATGGTETYARELVPRLAAIASDTQFVAFINRETAQATGLVWEGVEAIELPVRATARHQWVLAEQFLLPRFAARAGVDLLHSLANTGPAFGPFRRVTTIHDLHYRRVPEAHLGLMRYGMGILVPLAARRSDRIITPSRATCRDVARFLRVPADRIDVVPEAGGQAASADSLSEREIRTWLDAGQRPIVLSVSAKRPHKNLLRLIEALTLIPLPNRPLLVIPGYPTPHEVQLRERIHALQLDDDVRLLGWIENRQLEGLYAAAAGLVCPSLHEGFGLPVLEAMSRQVPVACSMGGALEEVAAGAALTFDPTSTQQMAETIQRLIGSAAEAAALKRAGFERAAQFSWNKTAQLTQQTYERTVRSRP